MQLTNRETQTPISQALSPPGNRDEDKIPGNQSHEDRKAGDNRLDP